jgi:Flp pilus assembly protein TadD
MLQRSATTSTVGSGLRAGTRSIAPDLAKSSNRPGLRPAAKIPPALVLLLALAGSLLMACMGCSYNRTDAGKQAFFATVRPASGDTSRILNNARYYKLWGRPELALKELEQAYRDNPDNLKVADTLAQSYEEVGDFKRAREIYRASLARHSTHPVLHNNLCYSYYQEGRLDQAEACFREALAQDPQNLTARNNLGLLLCRLGRQDEAHRLWQETAGEAAARSKVAAALKVLGQDVPTYAGLRPPVAQATAAAPAKVSAPPHRAAALPKTEPVAVTAAKPNVARPDIAAKVATAVSGLQAASQKPVAAPVQAIRQEPLPAAAQGRRVVLNEKDLAAPIEIRNGTRTQHLARLMRNRLVLEGFHIRWFGNHRDFGAEKTVILYRPGAEKVARALGAGFLPSAELQADTSLREKTDIKIIIGADFANSPKMLASLAGN